MTVHSTPPASGTAQRLLEVRNLRVRFGGEEGIVRAVDDVSFHIDAGETLGVVGESGSGKSVTSLAIMGLVDGAARRTMAGEIIFDGENLLKKSESEMRPIRGNRIAMIYQEPMTSLNPVHPIGRQIAEPIMLHEGASRATAMRRAVELLDLVGIPEPAKRAEAYPHQLSGGMRQRAMIAMALSCGPKLLIADEPTTALDVTIQAQILDLMRRLKAEMGMSILFITHDLGVIAEMADRVVVMYSGQVVEEAGVDDIFYATRMPYTLGLLGSIPRVDRAALVRERLHPIPGNVPNALRRPPGCSFSPRCRFSAPVCDAAMPAMESAGTGHQVRCIRWRSVFESERATA